MRRPSTLTSTAIALVAALTLAACGGSDDDASTDDGSEAAAEEPAESTDEPAEDATDSNTDETSEPAESTDPGADDAGNVDKPEVEFPGEAPEELVITVLSEGTGEPADEGDTVVVDYVGVRSLDGEEFDNSYDRGEPFPVVLGSGGVIQGWDQGLVGARTGARIQLDIPSDLAYGESARSDVIRENEPLTFVIDVRAVIGVPDASEAPTEPGVELSEGEGVEDTVFIDLVEGDGPVLEIGDTAVLHFVYFRGDNGVQLESSWVSQPITFPYVEDQLLPGLVEGLEGIKVGGRRAITIPPEDGFGPEGNPQGGLPAETDVIFVVDLLGAY